MATQMMPAVGRIATDPAWKRVGLEVVLVGVAGNGQACDEARLSRFRRKHLGERARVRTVRGDLGTVTAYGRIYGKARIPGSPTTYVIDRDGYLHGQPLVGPQEEEELTLPLEFLHALDRYRPDQWALFYDDQGRPRSDGE